ncbi:nuclear transport factor 2 family protein [Streptomyces sp. NPDC005752]|uniref:nuclear transport factor 2 family protein n=1 Tax=Streptomyces sp. NPDC005752 TaxID=3157065 RepID=UPI0034084011
MSPRPPRSGPRPAACRRCSGREGRGSRPRSRAPRPLRPSRSGQEYPPIKGRETIATALLGSLGHLDTTHSLSNPRVSLDGDTAHLEGIMACQHLPREDHSRHVLMTNRYDVDLARQGEVWVIRHVTVDNAWTKGDPTVLSGI